MKRLTIALTAALLAAPLSAPPALAGLPTSPMIDGSLAGDESFYGAALSVQNTRTQFGDGAGNPDPVITGNNLADAGGSEIDQVFATVYEDRLYVLVAGNLEGNFNKLQLFIDSGPGGVNTIDGAALPGGLDGFCCGGLEPPKGGNTNNDGALQRLDGLTFDSGFNADHALVFTHGGESVRNAPEDPDNNQFWALSSHYANLQNGVSGDVASLGYQLAPRGEPRVMRSPAVTAVVGDYNDDGSVNAADFTVWRDNLDTSFELPNRDPENSGDVSQADYDTWVANFAQATGPAGGLGDFSFKPFGNPGNSDELISDFTLAGLGQGELIDRNYALSVDGGCTDDTGAGCVARDLEFALDVDPAETGMADPAMNNQKNHRNFNNIIDLHMAIDNSNTEGVFGAGSQPFTLVNGEDNPEEVLTGIEFSVPLSELGTLGSSIKLMAFVNSNGHDFMSNQFAGVGVLDANLGQLLINAGGPPAGTFADVPGDQFITIPLSTSNAHAAPEPGALGLMLLVALGLFSTRRANV
ncbi:hypothetical protein Mal64_34800 [Pseudobythopirellula maris]|uniref:PEP-CTERM protein-sorting domain-containing protein n=1 Tax=Pseudobythopirellula maris TaxID=2527991 RepID=A0A5C5ZIM1_9BACT|nr:PEP-CTERM sorting domain-containing protein [Pseudobythopirellula maris]TWT86651.1 hypothetical protein Mal64_34800 [Pseudobythopirellula maris]